jgi:hypothetical protein
MTECFSKERNISAFGANGNRSFSAKNTAPKAVVDLRCDLRELKR